MYVGITECALNKPIIDSLFIDGNAYMHQTEWTLCHGTEAPFRRTQAPSSTK